MLTMSGAFTPTEAAIAAVAYPMFLGVAVYRALTWRRILKISLDTVEILNLMIGLLTPPVGMGLYVLSKVADVPFERCVVATAPFLVPLVAVLLLLTFVPGVSMWLPSMIDR